MVEGLLTGLSNLPSTSFADGDALWLSSTTGGWQNTPPANPAHGVYLGRVIKASNGSNAQAYIRIQNGYELNELHDVVIASPLDTHSVYYETATQLWKNRAAVDADLSAITVFPRFDADQSPTATQKRTARRNIGLSDSFTTADLLALSSTEAAKLRIAYCSDCLSSSPNSAAGSGDMCLWDTGASRWVTFHDQVAPETDWVAFALAVARRDDAPRMGPFFSINGDTINNVLSVGGYTTGTASTLGTYSSDPIRLVQINAGPGTTSTGVSRAVPLLSVNTMSSTSPTRKLAIVMSYFGSATAVSNTGVDELHWRLTLQSPVFSASAALQADEIAFVMDDRNTLGQGASGSNLRALCRLNGSTADWVDTGLAVTTASAFLIIAWEPNGPGAREGRARICSATDFGASITTHVDRSSSFSGAITSMQPCLSIAKTLGTGSRFIQRRFLKTLTLRTSTASGGIIS
jgi:hypothetical protein